MAPIMRFHIHGKALDNWKNVVIFLPSNITSLSQIMVKSVTESIKKHIGLQFFRNVYKLSEEEVWGNVTN